MKIIRRLFAVSLVAVAAAASAVFVEFNPIETQISGLGLSFLILPLGAWLIIFLLVGVLLGWLLSLPSVARISWRAQRSERALKKQANEKSSTQ
ncbi:MAG: lipopolysaccharide assembly protein LapA domain-containing protein [Halieaceae bacterium]|nr:lipopolysaccharide assembly protein LapA domain-containing protein [Halieaceae bacterium]